MASASITLTGAVGGPLEDGVSMTVTVSDDESDIVLEWLATLYGLNPDKTTRSPEDVCKEYLRQMVREQIQNAVLWKKQQMASGATENVSITPEEQ